MSEAPRNVILQGDALATLRELPDGCVQSCITSVPYWGLRSYLPPDHPDKHLEMGSEATPDEWCARLVEVFREVKRVLADDGTLWLNVGDAYATHARGHNGYGSSGLNASAQAAQERTGRHRLGDDHLSAPTIGLKDKDLIGLPWLLAFALRADGWWLRSDIVWSKPACMPESVQDRPTRAHEYLFLLSKAARYYYDADAIREPIKPKTLTTYGAARRPLGNDALGRVKADNWARTVPERRGRADKQRGHGRRHAGFNDRWDQMTREEQQASGANKRDVWTIASQPFPEAHFATMPPALVEPCVAAGTSEYGACEHCGAPWRRVVQHEGETARQRKARRGASGYDTAYPGNPQGLNYRGHHGDDMRAARHIGWGPECACPNNTGVGRCLVLDPFFGAGTVGLVAKRMGRDYLGIELSAAYVEMAERRIAREVQPMLLYSPRRNSESSS